MAWFRREKSISTTRESTYDGEHETLVIDVDDDVDLVDDTTQPLPTNRPRETGLFNNRFNGIMAPVFTCFKEDGRRSLDVRPINRYAEWLKSQMICGVLINGIIGEGPLMRVKERKVNCEYWQRAALRHNLMVMVHVGGAPLPDVLSLAAHAENVKVSGVVTLPELFYRPSNVDQLVRYCQRVAAQCRSRPFFYYHIPSITGVDLDMAEFCTKAESFIPNFMGLHYASSDLEMGQRCIRLGRIIMLASAAVLASGLMAGFNCCCLAVANIRPDIVQMICDSFDDNEPLLAREYQMELNQLIDVHTHDVHVNHWVTSMKNWFNQQLSGRQEGSFTAGPSRNVY